MSLAIKPLIYGVFMFCLLAAAYKKPDSQKLFSLIMFLCWVTIALSMDSYDIGNYRFAYDMGIYRRKEILFDILQFIFYSLGIHFDVFKILYGTVIWVLLYKAFQRYTDDLALATALFVFTPMLAFGTQMRNSMAAAILLNAFPLLFKKDSKIWKYCLLLVLASGFHAMSLFYIIFLLPRFLANFLSCSAEKFRNILLITAFILCPVIYFATPAMPKVMSFLCTLIQIAPFHSILVRLSSFLSGGFQLNLTGFAFKTCQHLIIFFVTDRMCVATKRLRNPVSSGSKNNNLLLSGYALDYMIKLNSMMLLIIPFYAVAPSFDRFQNYFTPICYCLIAQVLRNLRLTRKKAPIPGILDIPFIKKFRFLQWDQFRFLTDKKTGLLQPGKFELLLLIACLAFCFFVDGLHSDFHEFSRIVNGIAAFALK